MYSLAETAQLQDVGDRDRPALLKKLKAPAIDWNLRVFVGVPGPVWTVQSDTCMTGRAYAPANIAYDNVGQEFVFRQPRDRHELAGVMSAACSEVFDCYRFDGLQRWTPDTVYAWRDQVHVIEGWLRCVLATEKDPEFIESAEAYLSYLTSQQLSDDLVALTDYLTGPTLTHRLRTRWSGRGR